MSIRLIVVLTILTHLSFGGCRVILSLTAIHYQASPFTVGVVLSLLTVVPMFYALRWGRYVDRVGVRGPMLAGAGRIGLSATTIGIILGAFGAAVFVVRLALPLFSHRVSEWRMLIAAMLISGVVLVAFPLVSGVPLLIALAFLLGAGLAAPSRS